MANKPIPFKLLYDDSQFTIYSEPSRGLSHADIKDTSVYRKVSNAWSQSVEDEEKCIILRPNDLVTPLPRKTNHNNHYRKGKN